MLIGTMKLWILGLGEKKEVDKKAPARVSYRVKKDTYWLRKLEIGVKMSGVFRRSAQV